MPFFSAFFFLLRFSLFSFSFLSVCPFLPAYCPIWPSLPFVFFPFSPWRESTLEEHGDGKIGKNKKEKFEQKKKPVWPNPATHRPRVKPSLGFRALKGVAALRLSANLDRPILPSQLQPRKTAQPAPKRESSCYFLSVRPEPFSANAYLTTNAYSANAY